VVTLSPADFAFVSTLVRRDASIVLEPGKEYLVESRLAPLARRLGAASVSDLIRRAQGADPVAKAEIVDALTTNETSFFRDGEPFVALRETIVPQITARPPARRLRLWSAACSSGQEAYSVAMLLDEKLTAGWSYEIVGTDISTEMLERAKAGVFSQLEVNRGLPAASLVRYFERDGASWRVSANLRRNVTWQRLNLAAALPPLRPFDVIFLRNVLIYFDLPTKRAVLQRIASVLRPDGWLFLGSAESTIGLDDRFERVTVGRASAYRLRTAAPASSVPAQPSVDGARLRSRGPRAV
jgi:chemotaxis protein methyltransferase CheR